MLITHEQMKEINRVQVEILRAVSDVCRQLDMPCYMVHGSLLGTIRDHKFVPDDDDIDIALRREDYMRFVSQAPALLPKHYFVQTNSTDPAYPLVFGKVRDSRTTYIVEDSRHLPMNHGIYIDVFPIDSYFASGLSGKLAGIKYKLLNTRIASVFDLQSEPVVKRILRLATKVLFPSQKRAILAREKLVMNCKKGELVRLSGGKPAEQGIPADWFGNGKDDTFEGVQIQIPDQWEKYLTKIYGDYKNRTLIENKISDAEYIEVNACIVDAGKPYNQYTTEVG